MKEEPLPPPNFFGALAQAGIHMMKHDHPNHHFMIHLDKLLWNLIILVTNNICHHLFRMAIQYKLL